MIDNGQIEAQKFDLSELADRTVAYEDPFICQGGREKCDRKCQISRIRIGNKTYPFGGACNKYYNLFANKKEADIKALDLVALRERLLLKYAGISTDNNHHGNDASDSNVQKKEYNRGKVGINFSLMTNTLLPLYAVFFKALGYEVVYPDKFDAEGLSRKGAPFCWPVEQSHGIFQDLLSLEPDIIFLPHVKAFPVPGGQDVSVCVPLYNQNHIFLNLLS